MTDDIREELADLIERAVPVELTAYRWSYALAAADAILASPAISVTARKSP